jgi:hypothetical protein
VVSSVKGGKFLLFNRSVEKLTIFECEFEYLATDSMKNLRKHLIF